MRNGHRWHVYAVDTDHNRIAARRLDDGARTAFSGDYLREHITHGYAVTVHSAQGVTADTTHAVLGENTSRALLYVAMTRGRDIQHRLPVRAASPAKASTNTPSPPPVCTWPAAAPAATPPTSCAASSPTTTTKPAPPTTSPPKHPTATSCPTGSKSP